MPAMPDKMSLRRLHLSTKKWAMLTARKILGTEPRRHETGEIRCVHAIFASNTATTDNELCEPKRGSLNCRAPVHEGCAEEPSLASSESVIETDDEKCTEQAPISHIATEIA